MYPYCGIQSPRQAERISFASSPDCVFPYAGL